jgi:hypothetical protein
VSRLAYVIAWVRAGFRWRAHFTHAVMREQRRLQDMAIEGIVPRPEDDTPPSMALAAIIEAWLNPFAWRKWHRRQGWPLHLLTRSSRINLSSWVFQRPRLRVL